MLKNSYIKQIRQLLADIEKTEAQAISEAADEVSKAIAADKLVWVFGSSHAGILAEETFYRAGGLACVTPIFLPGLATNTRPITATSEREREPGYAKERLVEFPIEAGDVLIVHSVSGRNAAPVEAAHYGKEKGAFVIALTSLEYATASIVRNKQGSPLHAAADLVLDNHAPSGDALVSVDGLEQKVSPASTVLGAAILHSIMAEAAIRLVKLGFEPPVFVSANLEGGDEHNAALMERYKGRVTYI